MNDKLLKQYARAIRKRDKWAKRASDIADALGVSFSEITAAVEPSTSFTSDELALCRRGKKYHGAFTRIAKDLNVLPNTVGAVANGKLKSQRIAKAIRLEFARIDALPPDPEIIPLSDEEIRQFRSGGRYWGCMAVLARRLGRSKTTFSNAAKYPFGYKDSFLALRAEMAKIDADIAAKQGVSK